MLEEFKKKRKEKSSICAKNTKKTQKNLQFPRSPRASVFLKCPTLQQKFKK